METKKMYELVEKMYSEMQNGFTQINSKIDNLENKAKSSEKTVLKIENEHGEKLSALFDARETQKEVNEKIVSTLDRIEAKIDVLQMETAHIRRVK